MLYDWIKELSFAEPLMFGLLGLLLLLAWWYSMNHDSQQPTFTVSSAHSFTASSWKNRFRHLPFILRLLALACIITALARPQKEVMSNVRKVKALILYYAWM